MINMFEVFLWLMQGSSPCPAENSCTVASQLTIAHYFQWGPIYLQRECAIKRMGPWTTEAFKGNGAINGRFKLVAAIFLSWGVFQFLRQMHRDGKRLLFGWKKNKKTSNNNCEKPAWYHYSLAMTPAIVTYTVNSYGVTYRQFR